MFSELAANLDAAAQLLVKFMNDGDRQSIAAAILEHEHVGDKIVHDIVRRLNKSFITPIDREDIYDLVATADEVLDSIEEVTGKVLIYRVTEITSFARRQAEVIAKATPILRECMDNLEKPKGLDERIIAVNSLENDGDRIEREAIASLFEGDTKCTDIIKWKDIYETLECAIDECEHVANVIESIVLKHN
jgi:hypothetical protein